MADIELVIKIPKDVYTRLFDNGIQDNEIATDDICEMARSLRRGTPLDEVLDKIKAELHATAEIHEDENYYLREEWIDKIIDKYRKEHE